MPKFKNIGGAHVEQVRVVRKETFTHPDTGEETERVVIDHQDKVIPRNAIFSDSRPLDVMFKNKFERVGATIPQTDQFDDMDKSDLIMQAEQLGIEVPEDIKRSDVLRLVREKVYADA